MAEQEECRTGNKRGHGRLVHIRQHTQRLAKVGQWFVESLHELLGARGKDIMRPLYHTSLSIQTNEDDWTTVT